MTTGNRGSWFGMLMLLWALVLVSALAVVYSTHRSRQLFDELQKLSQEQNRLEVEWGKLLLERSTRSSLGTVEQMVRAWGMREPLLEETRVMQP
ncbi:MAG: cell division protein FtsL [Gammaproteobacteria bacterium]|nr:MAG: cell division protein FtsL [Gammaproteobacteria bacterium]